MEVWGYEWTQVPKASAADAWSSVGKGHMANKGIGTGLREHDIGREE
jgi:hypothetical protein